MRKAVLTKYKRQSKNHKIRIKTKSKIPLYSCLENLKVCIMQKYTSKRILKF